MHRRAPCHLGFYFIPQMQGFPYHYTAVPEHFSVAPQAETKQK